LWYKTSLCLRARPLRCSGDGTTTLRCQRNTERTTLACIAGHRRFLRRYLRQVSREQQWLLSPPSVTSVTVMREKCAVEQKSGAVAATWETS